MKQNEFQLQRKLRASVAAWIATPLVVGLMSMSAYAQSTTQKINLNDITVFLKGAELFNSGTVRLPAGESEVVFTNVAGRMNAQSLSISADKGVLVLSTTLRNDYLVDEAFSPKAQEIKDLLEATERKREGLRIQLSVIKEQVAVLQANRQLTQKDGGVSAAEVGRMLDLISNRMTAALEKEAKINLEAIELDKEVAKLQQQLAQERNKGFQPGGQVVVKFYAPQATTSNVRMSYVVNDAGWVPTYDLNVVKMGDPINLTYKANVFQNTGISWESVNLTLSTGNPSQGVQSPTLRPWSLSVIEPMEMARDRSMQSSDVQVMRQAPSPIAAMEESKVSSERVRGNTLDGYVTTNTGGVNTSFNIAIPYTVPSDGKGHMILIQSAKVPATYQYVVTPKLDSDAFLQAKVANWQGLNLLPGATNVYFENSFIGNGRINLNEIKDGMSLSLGRDKRILVQRVEDKNNRASAGMFGGSLERTFAYTIEVNNTRTDAVTLEVKDQLPVSRDSKITLEGLNLAGANHNKETGEITWTLNLKPSEQKSITYSYKVRYPKDAVISGL